MPFLASLVEKTGVARTTLHLAADPEDPTKRDVASKTAISDTAALGTGGEVVFMRFNALREKDRRAMLDPLEHGVPLVAFRTATHAFAYPDDSPHAALNAGFGERFLGTPWRFHHGHSSRTRVLPPDDEAARHPVLAGVEIPAEGIVVPSWLYHVEPLPADCRVLLWGEAVESERRDAPQRQPLVWVRERPPQGTHASGGAGRPGDGVERPLGDASVLCPPGADRGGLYSFRRPGARERAVGRVSVAGRHSRRPSLRRTNLPDYS